MAGILNAIGKGNYAYFDLAIGLLLMLSLVFPQSLFPLVDYGINALLGFVFILLIAGRGFGTFIVLFAVGIFRWLASLLKLEPAVLLLNWVEKTFMIFFVSYYEGLLLILISVVLIFPLVLLVGIAQDYHVDLWAGSGLEALYLQNKEVLTDMAIETFRPLPPNFIGGGNERKYQIFAFSMLLTAFSFFALFLIKAKNVAIGKSLVEATSKFREGMADPQRAERERKMREYLDRLYSEIRLGREATPPSVP